MILSLGSPVRKYHIHLLIPHNMTSPFAQRASITKQSGDHETVMSIYWAT